jgi:hypothetical protein
MTKIFCDRCGNPTLLPVIHVLHDWQVLVVKGHICNQCRELLIKFFERLPEKANA